MEATKVAPNKEDVNERRRAIRMRRMLNICRVCSGCGRVFARATGVPAHDRGQEEERRAESAADCFPPSPWSADAVYTGDLTRSHNRPAAMVNIRILRDIRKRAAVHKAEVVRRAYLAVARNETLSAQVRYQAQLQLNNMHPDTRPTQVKNRCIESGRGRGIIGEFGLSRVRSCSLIAVYSHLASVSIPLEGAGWRIARSRKSDLVDCCC